MSKLQDDVRKNVKVTESVKSRLEDLKKHLGVKTEGEVVAYLTALYDDTYPVITLPQHAQLISKAKSLTQRDSN